MRGFPSISPYLKPFGRKLGPPNPGDISRRFLRREDNILIDEFGRNAPLLLPVSEFSVDGSVEIPEFNFEVGKFMEFYINNNNTSLGHVFGSESPLFNGVRFVGADLSILIGTGQVSTLASVLNIGAIAKIKLHRTSINDVDIYKDDVNIGAVSNAGYTSDCLLKFIGKRHDGFYMNGSLWDINLNNELFIPLPHLSRLEEGVRKGWGYDQNGDAVRTTITGTVTGGSSEKGSRALLDDGFVSSNPELVVGGNPFTDGSWIKSAGVTIANGQAVFNSVSAGLGISQNSILQVGETFIIRYKISGYTDGTHAVKCGNTLSPISSGNGIFEHKLVCTLNSNLSAQSRTSNSTFNLDILSATRATPDIIPNNNEGHPLVELGEGNTYVGGTPNGLNSGPCILELFTIGDTDPEYTHFDKRNILIYPQAVRDDVWFDILHPGRFKIPEEINQAWNYDNYIIPYKYRWWVKLVNNQYRDLFLYPAALTEPDLSNAIKYVGVPE